MSSENKPTLDEVLAYAEPNIKKWISKEAKGLPFEQIEEILQEGLIRIIKAYPKIEADKGWKTYVYQHARGTVLDYLKSGQGFTEERWSIAKPEEHESRNVSKMRNRLGLVNEKGEDMSVDFVLGMNGEFDEIVDKLKINWDLVSRLASNDIGVNVFGRYIQGFSIEEIAMNLGLSRARIGQVLEEFLSRFDSPEWTWNARFQQICYAFGISHLMGFPTEDNGRGKSFEPVDIFDTTPLPPEEDPQMAFTIFIEEEDGQEES